jgi:DNA-binding CsgD family transcriptional regulator
VKDIHTKLSLGVSTARIARELSVSRATIYNYIKISIKEVEAVSLTPINI